MNKAVVIIRGNPENHTNWTKMETYIQENNIQIEGQENNKELRGDWFYDYRSGDSDWAFERYEDRLAFLKSVERDANLILVEQDFFSAIGQTNPFEQQLIHEVIRKIGHQLICIDDQFISGTPRIEQGADELFQTVMRYEKLRLTLSRIRTKQKNEEKGVINLQGKGKISGRKSYLEKDPELVRRVRKLRMSKYTNAEITKILFDLGYKTKTGKAFGRGMITRLYQQSELLPPE